MSRTLALLLAITLGLPTVVFISVVAAGNTSWSLISTLFGGAAVMAVAVAAVFEIHRLLEQR